ncbi:hypothetical protein PCE1_004389 [Barthelona sp. PCE]
MVKALKTEDGRAYVKWVDEKQIVDVILSDEPYTGVSLTSKDERVLATVHTSHIRVFSIPSLDEIYAVPTNSEVQNGCLSFDGQFLAFKDGDDYHVHCISSQSLISNVTFTKGSNSWVNSEAIFVQDSVNHVHKFIHGSSEAAMKFYGHFAVEQSDGEMFFLGWTGFTLYLTDCGNNILAKRNNTCQIDPISADISSNYLMSSESGGKTMVYNRSTLAAVWWENSRNGIEAVYISPDEEHFTIIRSSRKADIYNVQGKIVATVPSHCTGPTVSYDIVEDYLIKANTPLGSFFCCGSVIACEENYFIKKVENGCLCFFSSRIAYIYKENCITKKHDPHNGVIVNVTKDADSVFHVELDDGTFMLVEWTKDDGFGRILKCNSDTNNYGNAIDISELYSRISEQKLELDTKFERQKSEIEMKLQKQKKDMEDQKSEMQMNFESQKSEIEMKLQKQKKDMEDQKSEMQMNFESQKSEIEMKLQKQKKDMEDQKSEMQMNFESQKSEIEMKLQKQKKDMEDQKSEMDTKLQVVFDTLNQLTPNSGNSEYSALTEHVNDCAAAVRQLEMPPDSFFDLISSNSNVNTLEQHMNELEQAINFINSLKNIILDFELEDTLSITFSSKFSDLVAQFPIAKFLNEHSYAAKLTELQSLDVYFKVFDKYDKLHLVEVHSALIHFSDKSKALDGIVQQVGEITQRATEFREALSKDEDTTDLLDFNLIYFLHKQLGRHRSDTTACTCVHFKQEKKHLLEVIDYSAEQLKDIIAKFSLALDLTTTLKELNLSGFRLPITPKIIDSDSYLNGELADADLQNDIEGDDLLIKCVCVSKKFRGDLNQNLKSLQTELRVLSKFQPFVVALKNIVLVPEMRRGRISVKFVCIELERASYDLEQYLSAFPLELATKNDLAHQLVKAVFSMHANGIILRNLRPRNVLIYCSEDGSNPRVKLCDFGISIDGSHILGAAMVSRSNVQKTHKVSKTIESLGRAIACIYAQDRSNASKLVLPNNCAHSVIIERCQAYNMSVRPTIYELSCYEWQHTMNSDSLELIRQQINQFIVSKQMLLCDTEVAERTAKFVQMEQTFDEFFVRVFSNTGVFMSGDGHFGASITLNGMEQLSIPQFVDHIFELRALPRIDTTASEEHIEAMCGFLYCCFVFQTPVDDIQVGQFLLNALSEDYDKLSDRKVFYRVFPTESAYIINMLKHDGLNFNFLGGEDKLVTADNIDEFLQFAREFASEPYVELSEKVNAAFNSHELTSQLGVKLTFAEVKAMMCGPPRFTTEQVLATLVFDDSVPTNIRDAVAEILQGFNSLDLLQFVYWLNDSPELNLFTVILQPVDTMLPSVALCDQTLRLPNSVLRLREGIPLAIRGILPNEFKLFIMQRLSQWTQDDVDKLNNRLHNATLITIEFNNIPGVPSVRVCPNCLTPIEHGGACKSMKCFTCAREFCFSCLSPNCGHYGQCNVAPVQNVTLEQVKERMQQFQ